MSEDGKQIVEWVKLLIIISAVLFLIAIAGNAIEKRNDAKKSKPEQTTETELISGVTYKQRPSSLMEKRLEPVVYIIPPTSAEAEPTEKITESKTTKPPKAEPTEEETERPTEPPTQAQTEPPDEQDNNNYLGKFWVTAYCGCWECSQEYGNYNCFGRLCQPNHTIAVDPSVIPYGTRVKINGIVYTAEDCGGDIVGKCIDIYFAEHWQCDNFNTGYKDVYLA